MAYWLMKSEPEVFSIEDLRKEKTTLWEGVRNYQARNFMMNEMKKGDEILFYHSNAQPSGVAGLAQVSGAAVPDPTQFDKKSEYYDPKSSADQPRWMCVPVKFVETFKNFIPLEALREVPALQEMKVLAKGQRLSVQPVTAAEFKKVCELGRR